jgi:hypothetical protein
MLLLACLLLLVVLLPAVSHGFDPVDSSASSNRSSSKDCPWHWVPALLMYNLRQHPASSLQGLCQTLCACTGVGVCL